MTTEIGPIARALNAEAQLREKKQRTAILRNRLEICEEDCDSLEAETYRLRKDLRDIARWCESEALEAAGDLADEPVAVGKLRYQAIVETFNRIEAKLNALLGDS